MNPLRPCLSLLGALLLTGTALPAQIPLAPGVRHAHPDHHEFEAALWAPFLGQQGEGRTLKVGFGFVDAQTGTVGAWRLELVDARGRVRRTWHGETFLAGGHGTQTLAWDGRDGRGLALERGFYTLRLLAKPMAQEAYRRDPGGSQADRVERHLAASDEEAATQETTLCVGPAPRVDVRRLDLPVGAMGRTAPAMAGAVAAPNALPFTIYIGNLHSQTNHSDGGVPVGSCSGGENPQAGSDGPAAAYEMMRVSAGGDFLAATEHNHMYDGSTGTNTGADPAVPKALFDSGVAAASAYRTANPAFMALYGVEWGVISNGGHLNIFNPDGLPTWERNSSNQLLGHVDTPKSDYPALYATMKARGWVGQFNHPQTSQFNNLAFTADGDDVMALCEVSNSAAFSTSLTESDTFLSSYEIAWHALLERGFHLAPTSNQDNHCSNWGLSNRNRTGILVPTGTAWSMTAMLDAIRARRTFATHDKGSQIVLTTSGGAVMGDRINNSGPLTLQVHYATSTPGRSVSRVQIFEGVPGTPFSTVQMIEGTDTATFTPAPGNHYYYAKITQDDGRYLWSAPIWVNQAAGPVSASITVPSVNTTVLDGATVIFTGSATTTNTSITGHSWNFGDGTPVVTGTATPSHVFNNAGASPVVYTVTYTATDNLGETGSGSRLITVQPAGATNSNPTISDIPNQSTLKDTPVSSLGFTIGDAETNVNLLTVAGTSNNQTLLPDANITFGGGGSNRTITLTPAPDQTGSATVTVTVTDGAGATATDTFILNVAAAGGGAAKLIISQYYEGSSNNKYIEITNVGGSALDLASPQVYLALFSNAAADSPSTSAPNGTLALTGTLNPGASQVYRHASATTPAYASGAVSASAIASFNGDDLVILTTSNSTTVGVCWSARFDVVGDGTSWGADRSYHRNAAVTTPNATFNLAGEWTQATNATVDGATNTQTEYLGVHLFNLPASISDIAGQTIEANQQAGPVAFTVGGSGALTVTATSSNPTLLPDANIVLGGSGTSRTVTATPVADQVGTATITVTVTDASASSASDTFVLTVTEPNSTITDVTVSPVDPTVNGLSTTTFTATVTGTGGYSTAVVWSASGGTINALGEWTAPNTAGPFTITATSVQDGTKSGSSSVTVTPINTNPMISDITDKTTVQDTAIVDIPFTVGDAETPVGSLTVGATSSNTTLIPNANLAFGGSGANRTLTVTPAAGQTGSATITVTVTDGGSATATDTFVVTVTPPPSLVIISQYYEGPSFDKYVELTNTGTSTVNLASPQLYIVAVNYGGTGGGSDPSTITTNGSFALTGTLAPGQSRVFKHNSAANPAYAASAAVAAGTSAVNFNGNDIVFLSTSNSTTAGVAWAARKDVMGNHLGWVGQDRSFYRKPGVLAGNTAFDLAGEWTLAGADAAGSLAAVASATNTQTQYLGVHLFGTAPTVSDMANVTATVGDAIPDVAFTVGDAETPLGDLVITVASSNTTLLPLAGITVGGAGANRTLALAPAAGQIGASTVTVTVRDHGNLTASDTFVLTVNDVPPSSLAYSTNPALYLTGIAIAANTPSSSGGAVTLYEVSPALPAGLVLDAGTGVISGTPTAAAATATYVVTASNSGGSTTASLQITVVTPVISVWSGDGQTLPVTTTAAPLQARVTYGASVPLAGIPVVFTAPASGAGGTFASADPVLTDANGVATAPAFTANCTPGAYQVAATVAGVGPSASFNLANVAGAATGIEVTGIPSPIRIGTQAYVTVRLRDVCGNQDAGYRGRIRFTSTDPAAILPADYTFTGFEKGAMTFKVKLNTAGTHSVQVQDLDNGAVLGAQTGIVVTATTVTAVTALLPGSGAPGTLVMILGSGFLGTSSVRFNGVPAAYVVSGGNSIYATVPAGATTGKVTVVSPTGTAVSGLNFTILP